MAAPPLPLPKGAGMRVALRRTVRVRGEAGTELEDLGIAPDDSHKLTRADLLKKNVDLINAAGTILIKKLGGKDALKFEVTAQRHGTVLKVDVSSRGVGFVEVLVDGLARVSRDVVNDMLTFDLPDNAGFALPPMVRLEIRGYSDRKLVCGRRLTA